MILVFSFFVFVLPTFADETIGVLKAERVSAKAGDEISIPVSLVKHNGVCIIRVDVKYDSSILELKNVVNSASEHFSYTVNKNEDSTLNILMDSKQLKNIKEDITLFQLKFKVRNDAPSGRTLIRVFCEKGMATYLSETNGKIVPIAFVPNTSTGAVAVLCDNHDFVLKDNDGGYQCSKCGALKSSDGDVSVDSSQGLPEIDVSSQTESLDGSNTQPSNDIKINEKTDNGKPIKFVCFIPIISAILIISCFIAVRIIKSNRKK